MDSKYVVLNTLGTLEIIDVFIYYDQPQLFSCKSKTGQRYLAVCIDELEDADRWLYAPISASKLGKVKSGRISVHDAFKYPEEGSLWDLKVFFQDGKDEATKISPDILNEQDLPDKDSFLHFEDEKRNSNTEIVSMVTQEVAISDYYDPSMKRLHPPIMDLNTLDIALNTRRDVLDVALESRNKNEYEIECMSLGLVLINIQSLLYSLACKEIGLRGRIPTEIKLKNTLKAITCHTGSFGMLLQSDDLANLFGETATTRALELLVRLLSIKDNEEELNNMLSDISPKALLKYRNLLSSLLASNIDLKVDLASPNKVRKAVNLNQEEILSVLNLLESEFDNSTKVNTYIGELKGINVEKNTFTFKSLDKQYYSGSLSNELLKNTFQVPARIEAQIKESLEINPITQTERTEYELLSIKYLD